MRLQVNISNDFYDAEFSIKLLRRVQLRLFNRFNRKKLKNLSNVYPQIEKDSETVVKFLINNLELIHIPGTIIIQFNNNKFCNVSANQLAKTINFGSSSFSAYPIFTQVFRAFEDRINDYLLEQYCM